ncbi:MAG: DUF1858 domain-containing protein [Candidatus Zixiibacteriota bacterium]
MAFVLSRDTLIEDLVQARPDAVGFLIEHGLPCVVCGEPFWGTLAELAQQKNFTDSQIESLIADFGRTHAETD